MFSIRRLRVLLAIFCAFVLILPAEAEEVELSPGAKRLLQFLTADTAAHDYESAVPEIQNFSTDLQRCIAYVDFDILVLGETNRHANDELARASKLNSLATILIGATTGIIVPAMGVGSKISTGAQTSTSIIGSSIAEVSSIMALKGFSRRIGLGLRKSFEPGTLQQVVLFGKSKAPMQQTGSPMPPAVLNFMATCEIGDTEYIGDRIVAYSRLDPASFPVSEESATMMQWLHDYWNNAFGRTYKNILNGKTRDGNKKFGAGDALTRLNMLTEFRELLQCCYWFDRELISNKPAVDSYFRETRPFKSPTLPPLRLLGTRATTEVQ